MTLTLPERRILNLAGFLCCTGLMGFALFAQYVLLLDPCPLCVLQRIAVISMGIAFLVATLHNPAGWGSRIYALLLAVFASSGVAIAGWHVRMQNLPPSETPACGPGLDYIIDSFPLLDALKMVFTGSGECADVVWEFLGLSMPAWVVVCLVIVGSFGIWNNLRRT